MSQTITRLYDNYTDATTAVRELEAMGVSHDDNQHRREQRAWRSCRGRP